MIQKTVRELVNSQSLKTAEWRMDLYNGSDWFRRRIIAINGGFDIIEGQTYQVWYRIGRHIMSKKVHASTILYSKGA